MAQIYQPAEDSYLLQEVLKKHIKNKNLKYLDMGSGSGIQTKTLIEIGIPSENMTLVDINKDAIKNLKKQFPKSKVIHSNLFQKVKGKYDIIIFNPPYLPKEDKEPKDSRLATTGGKKGSEIINKFLKQAKKYLAKKGKVFLLTSSLTKGINWNGWKKKKLAEKKLFMEKLSIYFLE